MPHILVPFYLVIVDSDRKCFNVVGPMDDDTDWINRVVALQGSGRSVRCYDAGREMMREQIIAEEQRFSGYRHTTDPIT